MRFSFSHIVPLVLAIACSKEAERHDLAATTGSNSASAAAPAPSTASAGVAAGSLPACVRIRNELETKTIVEIRIAFDSNDHMVSRDITSTHPKLGASRQRFTYRWNPAGTLRELLRVDTDDGIPGERKSSITFDYGPHGELATIASGEDPKDVTSLEWKGTFKPLPAGTIRWAPAVEPFADPSDELPQFLAMRSTNSPMMPLVFTGKVIISSSRGSNGSATYDERGRMTGFRGATWRYDDDDQPQAMHFGKIENKYTWEHGRLARISGDGLATTIDYREDGLPIRRVHRASKDNETITYDYTCGG